MNTMEQNNQNSMVLIVDDTPKNIQVIGSILMEQKYRISVAKNGREALKVVKDVKPDIILLDIMMPELDGFETCKQLKESPETRDIPVIFLTAKIETEDIVKAFELGAVDYVIKPFNAKELLVRVNTHLDLKYAHEKIKKSEQELQKVNKAIKSQRDELARTLENLKQTQSQLIESKKMASLGGLVAGVAHEINTPVGIGITAVSSLIEDTKRMAELYKKDQISRGDFKEFLQATNNSGKLIQKNLERTAELVQSFKQVSVDQSTEQQREFLLKAYLEDVIRSLYPKFKRRDIDINIECDEELKLNSYPGVFAQIFTNLVLNSIAHGFKKEKMKGVIDILVKQEDKQLQIEYKDNGMGIPEEILPKIFDPFFTTDQSKGTGLGLNIVYNLVTQKLKGSIKCDSGPNKGVLFRIILPYSA